MTKENINKKLLNATKWSTITEIAATLAYPITNIYLVRIISPEAFGVVATVTMIMTFADMFTDAGFQKYLVQHEFVDEDEKHKNANVAFWTNLGISFILWTVIILLREQIAEAVGNQGLGNVIAIACIQLLLTSFSSIQMALFTRNFDFKTIFLVRIVSVIIPFAITIPLAILGLSYWSLIIANIATQLSNAVILTYKSKWKPYLYYDIKKMKEMLSFSIWSLVEAISIWFSSWADIFIISSTLNQYYLGLYKTSISMVNTLLTLVTASIMPVLFSALSRLQNDDEGFNKIFLSAQRFASIFIFPIGIGIFIYRDLATEILLGSKWKEASIVIGHWALTGTLMIVIGHFCSEVYRAKGRPKLSFFAQVLHLIVLVPTCLISSKFGFEILVYARAWIRMEFVIVHLAVMKLAFGFNIFNMLKNIFPTLASAFIMGILGYLLQKISNNLIWSFISINVCALFYFVELNLFPDMRKDLKEIMKKLKPRVDVDKLYFCKRLRKLTL